MFFFLAFRTFSTTTSLTVAPLCFGFFELGPEPCSLSCFVIEPGFQPVVEFLVPQKTQAKRIVEGVELDVVELLGS
jgi:hypothetical protein